MTYIDFPNAIDDRAPISRQALGYPYQGVFGESNDQIPSVDAGGWGDNGPLLLQPRRVRPDPLRDQVAVHRHAEPDQGVGHAHRQGRAVYWEHITNNQPGNGDSNGRMFFANWGGNTHAATPSPTC